MPLSTQEIEILRNYTAEKDITELEDIKTLPVMINILEDLKKKNEEKLNGVGKERLFQEITKEIVIPNLESFIERDINEINESSVKETIHLLIQEMREKLPATKDEYLINEIFLIYAIFIYQEADRQQNTNKVFLAAQLFAKEGDDFLKPFKALLNIGKQINITDEFANLWREAASWLYAMHTHTYKKMPDTCKQDGLVIKTRYGFPVIDRDDEMFKALFGICKYDIIRYHLANANVITSKLKAIAPKNTVLEQKEVSAKAEIQEKNNIPAPIIVVQDYPPAEEIEAITLTKLKTPRA